MNTLEITAPDATLPGAVTAMGDQPLALLRKGKPVGVLMPVGNCDLESISLSTNPAFLDILRKSDRSYYQHGGYSLEEIRAMFAEKDAAENGAAKPKPKRKKRTSSK
jgi:hypothetical protein